MEGGGAGGAGGAALSCCERGAKPFVPSGPLANRTSGVLGLLSLLWNPPSLLVGLLSRLPDGRQRVLGNMIFLPSAPTSDVSSRPDALLGLLGPLLSKFLLVFTGEGRGRAGLPAPAPPPRTVRVRVPGELLLVLFGTGGGRPTGTISVAFHFLDSLPPQFGSAVSLNLTGCPRFGSPSNSVM